MALVPLIEYADASPEVRAVYDDIMATRNVDFGEQLLEGAGQRPGEPEARLEQREVGDGGGRARSADQGALYVAVSVTNNCEYCIHSHTAGARARGMTPAMFNELMAVVALANETNRLSNGYRIDVDDRFRDPLSP